MFRGVQCLFQYSLAQGSEKALLKFASISEGFSVQRKTVPMQYFADACIPLSWRTRIQFHTIYAVPLDLRTTSRKVQTVQYSSDPWKELKVPSVLFIYFYLRNSNESLIFNTQLYK